MQSQYSGGGRNRGESEEAELLNELRLLGDLHSLKGLRLSIRSMSSHRAQTLHSLNELRLSIRSMSSDCSGISIRAVQAKAVSPLLPAGMLR